MPRQAPGPRHRVALTEGDGRDVTEAGCKSGCTAALLVRNMAIDFNWILDFFITSSVAKAEGTSIR
jgi:hypothetical protein